MAEKQPEPAVPDKKEENKGGESLEDLMSTLHKQIKGSDWLKQNTAEKWEEENKELAAEYKKAKEESEEKPGT